MIVVYIELASAMPKEYSQEILLCFVFYSNVFQTDVLSLRHETNPNMRQRKDRPDSATDWIRRRKRSSEQKVALILDMKSFPLKILFCLMPQVPLLDIHSMLKNFLPPGAFFQSSHFHDSHVMRLTWLFHLSLEKRDEQIEKPVDVKINCKIYLA